MLLSFRCYAKQPLNEFLLSFIRLEELRLEKGSTLDANVEPEPSILIIRSASFLPTDLVVLWEKANYDMKSLLGRKKNFLKRPWHQVQVRYKQPSIRGLDQSLTPVSFNLNICSLFSLDSQLKSNLLFFTSSLLHLQSSLSELIQKPSSSPSLLLLTSLPLRVGKPLLVLLLLARMLQVMG